MAPLPRYFANDSAPSRRDPHKQLVASLTRIVTEYPPDSIKPGGGLYYGPTSIAFLFFALQQFYKDFEIEGVPLGTWYATYMKVSEDAMTSFGGPRPDKCGVIEDILAAVALGAASSRDTEMAKDFCDYAAVAIEDGASNEWLYGRAGYLYLLRLMKASFVEDEEMTGLIEDTADVVIEKILEDPRPWKWSGKNYVGAAHGAIGIITQVVLTDPSYASKLEPELAVLLSYQYEGGNWPSSLPPGKDRLVQFCHGAPGVVSSLLSVRKHFPRLKERIDAAIDTGRTAIKERGLLTKEPCLCHGISGNALAMADEQFEHFLSYTTAGEMKGMKEDKMLDPSDDPSALWLGEAGRAWAWAVADKGLERRFLGYNDL